MSKADMSKAEAKVNVHILGRPEATPVFWVFAEGDENAEVEKMLEQLVSGAVEGVREPLSRWPIRGEVFVCKAPDGIRMMTRNVPFGRAFAHVSDLMEADEGARPPAIAAPVLAAMAHPATFTGKLTEDEYKALKEYYTEAYDGNKRPGPNVFDDREPALGAAIRGALESSLLTYAFANMLRAGSVAQLNGEGAASAKAMFLLAKRGDDMVLTDYIASSPARDKELVASLESAFVPALRWLGPMIEVLGQRAVDTDVVASELSEHVISVLNDVRKRRGAEAEEDEGGLKA